MSSDNPRTATPAQVEARSGSNERIVPKGTIIDIRDNEACPMCCMILSGSVAVEVCEGTVSLDVLLQGDTFNEQYVFSNCVDQPNVQYRALTRCALRVFDRKTLLTDENQAEIRELYRAAMRTRVRQSMEIPRRMESVLRGINGELEHARGQLSEASETLAEKEQELAATTRQMTSAQATLEQTREKMGQMSQELATYERLVRNHEATLKQSRDEVAKARGDLKAARVHEAEVVKALQEEMVRAQDATQSTQDHMRKIHRALEKLSIAHPEVRMDKEIMLLWLGENPDQGNDEDLDRVFEEFLSDETPTRPIATLIPDSGVPGARLEPIPQNVPLKLDAPQVPRPAMRPPARFSQPIPREEPDDTCMQVRDDEISSIPPPRATMETIGFDESEAPTGPFRDVRQEEAINTMMELDSVPPTPGPPTIPPSGVQCAPAPGVRQTETTREINLTEFRRQYKPEK